MTKPQGRPPSAPYSRSYRGAAGRTAAAALVLAIGIAMAATVARTEEYPARPIRMIVPYPAGGITDILPRIMQERLTRKWGQPIVIDNRPGAAGNIGTDAAHKSAPDGYTLLVTAPSPFTVNQSLYAKLPFDPAEFVPVSIMATIPTGLVINPKLPIYSVADLIAYAKPSPGKVAAATQGKGTTSHLTSEWFQIAAGVKFLGVSYRGSAPALQEVVAGDVDLMFDNLGISLALAQSGQLRMIGVATPARLPTLPEVPAIAETLPGFVSNTWVGVFLPPRTPRAIAERLSRDLADVLAQPEIAKRFIEHGCEPVGSSPEAAADFVRGEAALWQRVIAQTGIKPE